MASDSPAPEEAIRKAACEAVCKIRFSANHDGCECATGSPYGQRCGCEEIVDAVLAAWNRRTGGEREQQLREALERLMPYFEGEHAPDHPDVLFARAALAGQTEGERNGG